MAGTQGKTYKGGDTKKLDIKNRGNNKRNNEVDWVLLREEWITTNISLTALAEKYKDEGLTVAKVKRQYNRDKWHEHLAKYNDMVASKIEEARKMKATYLASRVIALDELVMTTSEKVVDIINYEVDKIHPDKRKGKKEKISDEELAVLKETATALNRASNALKNSHYNIRLACDKATSIIDDRVQQKTKLEDEDINRIAKEMGFIKDHNDKPTKK